MLCCAFVRRWKAHNARFTDYTFTFYLNVSFLATQESVPRQKSIFRCNDWWDFNSVFWHKD